jgi:hypothetical protein
MPTYTYTQLEDLWMQAGGSRAAAAIAAAIAMAESGGRSWVTSANPDGGTNVGPWQLDTRGKGAGYTVAQLQDGPTNARLAVAGSNDGHDWSAWATWVSGAYKQFLGGHGVPPGTPSTPLHLPNPLGVPGQVVGAFKSAGTALDWLLQPNHWVRIFCGTIGAGAVLGGLWILSHVGGEAR